MITSLRLHVSLADLTPLMIEHAQYWRSRVIGTSRDPIFQALFLESELGEPNFSPEKLREELLTNIFWIIYDKFKFIQEELKGLHTPTELPALKDLPKINILGQEKTIKDLDRIKAALSDALAPTRCLILLHIKQKGWEATKTRLLAGDWVEYIKQELTTLTIQDQVEQAQAEEQAQADERDFAANLQSTRARMAPTVRRYDLRGRR